MKMRFLKFLTILLPLINAVENFSFQVQMKTGNKNKYKCHGIIINPDNVVFPFDCEPRNQNFNIFHNNEKLEVLKKTSNDVLTIYNVYGIKENIEPLFASEYYPYYAVTQQLNFIKYKNGNIFENSIEIVNNDTCDNLFNMEDYHFCLGERNKRRRKNCSRDKGKAFYLETPEGKVISGMAVEGCPDRLMVTKSIKLSYFLDWIEKNGGPIKIGPDVCKK